MNTNEPKKRTTVADVVAVNTQLLQRIDSLEQQVAVRPAEASAFGEQVWKRAGAIARSTVIPKRYQGKGGQANVFVAMEIADRMGLGAFEVMQNLNVIQGTPSWSSSYAIGLANQRGPFKGPIQFDVDEKAMSVTAYATIRETGKRVEYTVTMEMATKAGWTSNALYKNGLGLHMCHYRSAVFLIRLHCPEVLFGMQTTEEVEDVSVAKQVSSSNRIEALNNSIVAAPEPEPEPEPIEVRVEYTPVVEPEPTPEPEPEKAGNREFF